MSTSQKVGESGRCREHPKHRRTRLVTEVFRKFPTSSKQLPSCFLWQCKFAETKKESSVREEPIAALRLETHRMFELVDPRTIGTQDNLVLRVPVRGEGRRTGRIWPDPGMSHKAQNTIENVLSRFWWDCVADKLGNREKVPPYAGTTEVRVLQHYDSDGQGWGWNGGETCGLHVGLH